MKWPLILIKLQVFNDLDILYAKEILMVYYRFNFDQSRMLNITSTLAVIGKEDYPV